MSPPSSRPLQYCRGLFFYAWVARGWDVSSKRDTTL